MIPSILISLSAVNPTMPDVVLAGTTWYGDPVKAAKVAHQQAKPLLIFEMFGRLDETFC